MSLEIYTFTGGWLDQVGIRLSQLSTNLNLKLKLKLSLAISMTKCHHVPYSEHMLLSVKRGEQKIYELKTVFVLNI